MKTYSMKKGEIAKEWLVTDEEILAAYLTFTAYGGNLEGIEAAHQEGHHPVAQQHREADRRDHERNQQLYHAEAHGSGTG